MLFAVLVYIKKMREKKLCAKCMYYWTSLISSSPCVFDFLSHFSASFNLIFITYNVLFKCICCILKIECLHPKRANIVINEFVGHNYMSMWFLAFYVLSKSIFSPVFLFFFSLSPHNPLTKILMIFTFFSVNAWNVVCVVSDNN